MRNNIRSDFYRLFKGRGIYVSIIIVCILFFFMQFDNGVKSDTLLASYDASNSSLIEFLYYFPKALFFTLPIIIVLALFRCEEFNCGFVKNIVTCYDSCTTLLLSRWVMSLLVWIIQWAVVTIMIVLMNIFVYQDPSLYTINIFDYGMYCILQMLILSAVIAFVDLIIYLFRNKTLAVVIAIMYSGSIIYMVHLIIISNVPGMFDYSTFTLTYASGNLPYIVEVEAYSKAFMVAISSLILYTIGNSILLKKKDII